MTAKQIKDLSAVASVAATDVFALDDALNATYKATAAQILTYIQGAIGTAYFRTLIDDVDAATARGTLGVVIGTNVQAWDADLDTWAGKTPPSGTVVGTSDSQTLTNKTLTAPIIATINNSGTLTLPTGTDTLVGRASTDTLTNKTLTSPTINTATISGGTINNNIIGGSTPAAGTFTTLTASSLNVTSTSAPANGVYLRASNETAISSNSILVASFTATSGGNRLRFNAGGSGGVSYVGTDGADTTGVFGIVNLGQAAINFYTAFSTLQFAIDHVASAVNTVHAKASATGSPVELYAAGSDSDIDFRLTPKGTGVMRFGTHSAIAAETVTGYITIKDSGGTNRKLAVVS